LHISVIQSNVEFDRMRGCYALLALGFLTTPALTASWSSVARPAKATISQAAKPTAQLVRRVMVSGNGDLDTCLSTSFVREMKPGGFLSVRAGPSPHAKEIARLRPGNAVWNCDSAGEWVGIVYRPGQRSQDEGIDCNLGPSNTARRPYRGDCQSGWVNGRYLLSLAG
jgi:hypothetical protein